MLGRDTNTAKAEEDVPALGEVDDPVRGAQEHGRIDKRTAAQNPCIKQRLCIRKVSKSIRQYLNFCGKAIATVAIPAPFPDIAVHIIQTPAIRSLACYNLY